MCIVCKLLLNLVLLDLNRGHDLDILSKLPQQPLARCHRFIYTLGVNGYGVSV